MSDQPSPNQEVELPEVSSYSTAAVIALGNHGAAAGPWVKFEDCWQLLQAEVEKRVEVEAERNHLRGLEPAKAWARVSAAESKLSSVEAGLEDRIDRALEFATETAEQSMGAPQEPERQQDLAAGSAAAEAVRGACEQLLQLLRDKGTEQGGADV